MSTREMVMCKIEGCNKSIAKGLCRKHYNQLRKHGRILKYSCRFTNYEDAVKARNKAALKYYGEFANEN